MYYVLHRDRGDTPGEWRRSGPFEDRPAAEAFVAALARARPGLEGTRIQTEEERPACS